MQTDYLGIHEVQYQKLRACGKPWTVDAADIVKCVVEAGMECHIDRHGKVLELGCGDGNVSLALAERGYDIQGIDISPTAISWANEKAGKKGFKADFKVGNVLKLPYDSDYFDVVIDAHCFHCIIGEDRKLFLANALKTLRPDGLFIVMTMCNDPVDTQMAEIFDQKTRCCIKNNVAGRYFGLPHEILFEITAAGFNVFFWKIDRAHAQNIQDELIVWATKSR